MRVFTRGALFPQIIGVAVLLVAGCSEGPTVPGDEHPAGLIGVVEITISGLADGYAPTASALSAASVAELEALRRVDRSVTNPGGPLFALTPPDNGGGGGDGTIQLELVSTGSFTEGTRSAGGVRYVHATFRLRNAQSDSTPYDTPRANLTFLAVATAGTIDQTAVSQLRRFDGTAASSAIAVELTPTGAVERNLDAGIESRGPDVLQVLTETEVAGVTVPPGVTDVLPYAFVVRNPNDPSSRALPASPAADQFDGVVTFAFKLPLQATAADDPFTISIMVMGEDDSDTRLTQSLEESGAVGSAQAYARASALGAGAVRVLPGVSYTGDGTLAEPVCVVRTAGTAGSPTAYLVNETVGSVSITQPTLFLVQPGAVRDLLLDVQDAGSQPITVAAHWTHAGAGIGWLDGMGTALGAARLGPRPVSSTLSATVCGQTSGTVVLWNVGYVSISGGGDHSLAIKSDGTVAGWGLDGDGQATPPGGLANVVQVGAGFRHSVALKADGTVEAWGSNSSGQATVPPGLTDVVQVVAGGLHSLALRADGTVVGWGSDADGQTTIPPSAADVVQVSTRLHTSLALLADSTVVAWGLNVDGQATVPGGLSGVVQIAAGYRHSLALLVDSTVVGWGNNDSTQATPPGGLTGVVRIAAGPYHSLALLADGTVVGWGGDQFGRATPPVGLDDVVQIWAGFNHSVALKADGTVVAWGLNASGQITVPALLVALVP
jgi:hypothetical protein